MLLFRLSMDDFKRSIFLNVFLQIFIESATYVKIFLGWKIIHEAARDFQSVKIQFRIHRRNWKRKNDDKSDQNSIESGSKSINETNEVKIAEFLLEIN